jgi:hypothetical protein
LVASIQRGVHADLESISLALSTFLGHLLFCTSTHTVAGRHRDPCCTSIMSFLGYRVNGGYKEHMNRDKKGT